MPCLLRISHIVTTRTTTSIITVTIAVTTASIMSEHAAFAHYSYEERVRRSREAKRHASEAEIQRWQEMRRLVNPQFGPAVDGVLWNRICLGEAGEANDGLQTPVLSILQFTLKPGSRIGDDSTAPRQLWDAALHYISSVPGFRNVEWGLALEDPPAAEAVVCMIQWASTAAWQTFQYSLGFSSMISMLGSFVSNRCAKLSTSALGTARLGHALGDTLGDAQGGRATVVEVVSITFDAEQASTPERRATFEETWNTLVASATHEYGDGGGPRHSYVVWLENNATMFFDPTPDETAAATLSATFTALLSWDEAHYDSRRVEDVCGRLRQSTLAPFRGDEPIVSRTAVRLIGHVVQQEGRGPPRRFSAAPLTGLAAISDVDFQRQCSDCADLAAVRERGRQALNRSISDARTRARLFPAPQGSFISQGELYVGNMPVSAEWHMQVGATVGPPHHVDLVWMKLKRGGLPKRFPLAFNQLKDEIGALPGCVKASWALDVENKAKVAVLTVWEGQHERAAALREYRRIWDDFAGSFAYLSPPLTHQASFPMPQSSVGLGLDGVRYLELTCFHIPPGALERRLFEHAYGAFTRITEPSLVAGIPTACRVMDAGGWQATEATSEAAAEAAESSGRQLFTGVLRWENPAARQEWYEALFSNARESYELFGHKLDTLKILAAGGIATRFLELQTQ